jgi:hypothetical protein
MTVGKRGRGRPRKEIPFFNCSKAERQRVKKRLALGFAPFPKYTHEPCEAEKSLRNDVMPGVPFDLVLAINSSDEYGQPLCGAAYKERYAAAAESRKEAAINGGEMRPNGRLADTIVSQESGLTKLASGWSLSRILRSIDIKLEAAGRKCAGRSDMYAAIARAGLSKKSVRYAIGVKNI